VFRAKTAPALYLLTPLLAPPAGDQRPGAREVDCLVLNKLPFADDFRAVQLPSFGRSDKPEVGGCCFWGWVDGWVMGGWVGQIDAQ